MFDFMPVPYALAFEASSLFGRLDEIYLKFPISTQEKFLTARGVQRKFNPRMADRDAAHTRSQCHLYEVS
jgi:hypothetical protein